MRYEPDRGSWTATRDMTEARLRQVAVGAALTRAFVVIGRLPMPLYLRMAEKQLDGRDLECGPVLHRSW